MANCTFVADGKTVRCTTCGTRRNRPVLRWCPASPQSTGTPPAAVAHKKQPCPHLLDPTGETTLCYGWGCPSTRVNGAATAVFECELHGRCAPLACGTHLADATIVRCVECADHPQKNPSRLGAGTGQQEAGNHPATKPFIQHSSGG